MKRHLMTLILSGFLGSMVLAGNAEACHKKKCRCAPTPCAVVVPAPCPPTPVCMPTCAPKVQKCGGMFSCFKGMKHGHKTCAAPAPCYTTIAYSAPAVYSSPQTSAQH
jgi:hypothetical protein